jgi:glutamate dehydrogenase (NAD(P)+)
MKYSIIGNQINECLKHFNINKKLLDSLKEPNKIVEVNFPYKNKILTGYRVQHNNILGPYKGGLRFNENVSLDECKSLSAWMTYKTALHYLPLGGGKGGLSINPREYNNNELEEICGKFVKTIHKDIGENIDIPAPDVGTTSVMMDYMNMEQFILTGKKHNFTGKTLKSGGIEGREEATGYGVFEILKQWCIKKNFDLHNARYILQGFGNVGQYTAKYLSENHGTLIAVGDHSCYIRNERGIDVENLINYVNENGCIKGFQEEEITIEEFWKTKCAVVIPAALEEQIDASISRILDCKLVLEAANGPLTKEADDILKRRNIEVLPDILVNSGGVIVSHYEYLKNKNEYLNTHHINKDNVLNDLSKQLQSTFNKVYNLSKEKNTTYRNCCYGLALENLEKASSQS